MNMRSIIGHLGAGSVHSQDATVGRLWKRLADGRLPGCGSVGGAADLAWLLLENPAAR